MKTILALAFVALVVWVAINRQRVYVRDPLATVYRDELQQQDDQVYLNFSNDLLLISAENTPPGNVILQQWDQVPGTPQDLSCLRWLACITDNDHAPKLLFSPSAKNPGPSAVNPKSKVLYTTGVTMTARTISFTDATGTPMRIQLH